MEDKEDAGMEPEKAEALWEKRVSAPGAQIVDYNGVKALVRSRPSTVAHGREQAWEREIHQPLVSLENTEQQKLAHDRLQALAAIDLAGEAPMPPSGKLRADLRRTQKRLQRYMCT